MVGLSSGRRPVPGPALLVGAAAGLAGLVALRWAGLIGLPGLVVGAAVLSGGESLLARYRHRYRLGWANAVTLARLVGVSWIAALTVTPGGPGVTRAALVVMLGVGVGCLVLDGIDGRLARARGESSPFGARFDLETDAALLLVLAVAAGAAGAVGWWVLAIGLLRYAYWLTSFVVPALRVELPPSTLRKTVAVVQGAALLIGLAWHGAGLRPTWMPSAVAAAALAALLWSFASATVAQLRLHRAADDGHPQSSLSG